MTNCNSPVLVTKCAQLSISSASFGSAYNLNNEKSIFGGQLEYYCVLNEICIMGRIINVSVHKCLVHKCHKYFLISQKILYL